MKLSKLASWQVWFSRAMRRRTKMLSSDILPEGLTIFEMAAYKQLRWELEVGGNSKGNRKLWYLCKSTTLSKTVKDSTCI